MEIYVFTLLQAAPTVIPQASNWVSIATVFIIGLPSTIAAIGGIMSLLQSRRNAEVAASTAALVVSNDKKTDTVIEKATEIHTLTNSNLSKLQGQLDVTNRTIESLHQAQVESARRMANMELLITSLVPAKGQATPSQTNTAKLDALTAMVSDVQHGTPPIPVVDEAVLQKLDEQSMQRAKQAASTENTIVEKLDTIQESADTAAKKTSRKKRGKA